MARRLFSSRRRGYDGDRGFGSHGAAQPRARAVPVPAPARRRRRAGRWSRSAGCSRASSTCRSCQHEHYQTLAETNRIAIVPIVPNRGVILDRNGVVLAQSYSAYTLEITPARVEEPRRDDRRARRDRRHPAARPQALPQAARRVEELREPAAAHAPLRRGGRALRRQPLPLPRRRDQGAAVPPVSVRRDRLARDRLHRPHQRHATSSASTSGTRRANYKGSDYIGKVGVELSLRARAARHDRLSRRSRSTPAAARCARCRARRRCRATTCALSLDIKLQEVGGAGVRRPPRRAGRDRARDRRRARVRLEARLRSEPVRRRHRLRELGGAQRLARQAAAQPAAARRLSAGLDDQAVPGAGRARPPASARRSRRSSTPAIFQLPGPAHRFRDDKPGGHGTVDMYKSIVVSCDTYYYMLASETDIDDTARFLSQLGFGQQDRHRHRGRADRHAAVARMEAQALRRQEVPRGASQVVPGRHDLRRHRPGLQRVHADAARARDRDDRQRRRRVPAAPREERSCNLQDRRGARRSRREPSHTLAAEARAPRVHQERAGRREQGRHQRRGVRQAPSTSSAGKTGTAQVYSLKGEKYTRAKVDERLRDHAWFIAYAPADKPQDRARGAGRERRLRRAGRGADRAQGVRLLPARRAEPGPAPAAPAPAAAKTRATDAASSSSRRVWEVLTRRIDSFLFGVRAGARRRRPRHAVLGGRPERRARDDPGRRASRSRWC